MHRNMLHQRSRLAGLALTFGATVGISYGDAKGQGLFVATDSGGTGTGIIHEYTAAGGDDGTISGLTAPFGVAVQGDEVFVLSYSDPSGNFAQIGEYSTNGNPINADLITGIYGSASGMTIVGNDIFVTKGGTANNGQNVAEFTTGGAVVNLNLITVGVNDPQGIVVAGGDIFITNYISSAVGEYTLAGATVNSNLISTNPQSGLSGLATDGKDLFVAGFTSGIVGEYGLDGSAIDSSLISLGAGTVIESIAESGDNLYILTNAGDIAEYTTDGVLVNSSLVTGDSSDFGAPTLLATASIAPEPSSIVLLSFTAFPLLNLRGRHCIKARRIQGGRGSNL